MRSGSEGDNASYPRTQAHGRDDDRGGRGVSDWGLKHNCYDRHVAGNLIPNIFNSVMDWRVE